MVSKLRLWGDRRQTSIAPHDSDRHSLFLILILLLALALRLWNIDHPVWQYADEQNVIDRALLLGHLGLNPGWFIYPSLFLYVLFVSYGLFYVIGSLLGFFASPTEFASFYFANPLAFYLAGRGIAIACGLACLVATYWVGRERWGVDVGLAAAGFLAVSPSYVSASRFVKPDILMALLFLLAVLAVLRYLDAGRNVWLWSASLLVGFAASTKYLAAMGVLLLVLAPVIRRRSPMTIAESALAVSLAGVGFVVGSPFAVLDWETFLASFAEVASYMNRSWYGAEDQTSGYMFYLFQLFPRALGWPATLIGLVGLARWLFRGGPQERLLTGFVVSFYMWMGYSRITSDLYILIIIPVLILAGVDILKAAFVRLRSTHPALFPWILYSVITVCILPPVILSVRDTVLLKARDTRELTVAWFVEHLPPGTRILSEPGGPLLPRAAGRLQEIIVEERQRRPGMGMRLQFELEEAKLREGFWYYEIPLFSDRYLSQPAHKEYDLDKFLTQGYRIVVLSSSAYGRYRRFPERYPIPNAFFERVVREGVQLASFGPSTPWCCPQTLNARLSEAAAEIWGRPGPTLLIYRLPDK